LHELVDALCLLSHLLKTLCFPFFLLFLLKVKHEINIFTESFDLPHQFLELLQNLSADVGVGDELGDFVVDLDCFILDLNDFGGGKNLQARGFFWRHLNNRL